MSCRISRPRSALNFAISTCSATRRPIGNVTGNIAKCKSNWFSRPGCRSSDRRTRWATMRRANNKILLTLAAATTLVGIAARAQQQTPPPQPQRPANQDDQTGAIFRSDTRLVVLHTTVVDKNGHLVTDLKQNAFTVFENGVTQPIRGFKREDVPVSMGLIIDNSGSMRDKRAKVEAAALALVKASNKDEEVFVVNFNDEACLDNPHGKDLTSDGKEVE